MPKVTVHSFKRYVITSDTSPFAPAKATAESIEKWDCQIIPGTAEEVEADELDDEGRYYAPGTRPKGQR